jgi:hypothetical protein
MMISLLLLWSIAARADVSPPDRYSDSGRAEMLKDALTAFDQAPRSLAETNLHILRSQSQYNCSAGTQTLKVQCLMEVARNSCKGQKPACMAIADVIISNISEEDTFVSKEEMHKILRHTHGRGDPAMLALNGRYARLTTDYMTATKDTCRGNDWPCLAAKINGFCLKISDEKKQSWQGCAGAIVWFIGHEKRKRE